MLQTNTLAQQADIPMALPVLGARAPTAWSRPAVPALARTVVALELLFTVACAGGMFGVSLTWYRGEYVGQEWPPKFVLLEPKIVDYQYCAAYTCGSYKTAGHKFAMELAVACIWAAGLIGAALSLQGVGAVCASDRTRQSEGFWCAWSGGCTAAWAAGAALCCAVCAACVGTASGRQTNEGSEIGPGFYAQVVAAILGSVLCEVARRTKAPGQATCCCCGAACTPQPQPQLALAPPHQPQQVQPQASMKTTPSASAPALTPSAPSAPPVPTFMVDAAALSATKSVTKAEC